RTGDLSSTLCRSMRLRWAALIRVLIVGEISDLFDDGRGHRLTSQRSSDKERLMRHRIPTLVIAAATCTAALTAFSTPAQAAPAATHHSAATVHGHAASPAAGGSGLLSYGGGTVVTS